MDKKLKVVFASHTFIGGPFVVGSHHLAREMTNLGHEVLHISTPITPFHYLSSNNEINTLRKKISREVSRISSAKIGNIPINYVPFSFLPWKIARTFYRQFGINFMVNPVSIPSMRKHLKQLSFLQPDILFIDQPTFLGIESFISPKVTVYRATDLYKEMTGDPMISKVEEEVIKGADGIVGTSEPVVEYLKTINRTLPNLLIENGVDFEHFATSGSEPEEYKNIPFPRAVYVGALDDRFDFAALESLAKHITNLQVVVIGPGDGRCERLSQQFTNIHFLGPKPYSDLPSYLNHCQIALLPLSDHEANRGRSPMKLYEYAASGLPVIVKETPELQRRKEKFTYMYKDPESLISVMNRLLNEVNQNKVNREEIQQSARSQSWKSKASQLLEFSLDLPKKVKRY
ncbi:hypothetical protein BCV73_02850 [Paenibacillus sp. SSG-1]|uniref:glycosyltransferase n=1 Tax=Paenibacillus sp. SSG-1 TaxID=1443669 RepID=UPI000B7FDCF1|nr:glycosyltransferase [Paenibacillus sp. SSG-1]OXL82134.1 hypothetical protein BCV73_02850 [Paenibacillus sp. SSG-1]